ncbi:hypothetical protein [Lacticaseibacillus rhamnosus]|nr:hypothetical protein [Lacticaseibacillus rhamnosus]
MIRTNRVGKSKIVCKNVSLGMATVAGGFGSRPFFGWVSASAT